MKLPVCPFFWLALCLSWPHLVNAIAWAPHELGLCLACASSDGKVSILTARDGQWDTVSITAHPTGCTAISWAPAAPLSALLKSNMPVTAPVRRFATGGCDNLVKVWRFAEEEGRWSEEVGTLVEGHTDWVRDVAWAPSIGLNSHVLASCSQVSFWEEWDLWWVEPK